MRPHPSVRTAAWWTTVLCLMPLVVLHGRAEEAAAPAKEAPPPPALDAVIAAFGQHVAQDARWSAEQKALVEKTLRGPHASPAARAEALPACLARLFLKFQAALDAIGEEDFPKARGVLADLVKAEPSAKSPYLNAYARLTLARLDVMQERYEDALPGLRRLLGEDVAFTAHAYEALFLKARAHLGLLQRDQAETDLQRFLKCHADAPERMVIGARQMLLDIAAYRDGGLQEVQLRMDDSRRRLQLEDPGKDTRKQQEQVVALLDKLIEEAEKQQQGGGGGGGGGGGQGQGGPPSGNGQSSSPAQSSSLPGGEGRIGALGRVVRGKEEESWGKMPERKREEVLNALKTQFPDRYRELVEQYYKSLQKEGE